MMSFAPVAGGDASASSGLESSNINFSDDSPRPVQRRMETAKAEKRQRLTLSESVTGHCRCP